MDARLYEGMFLIDAAKGGADLPAAVRNIVGLLERHGAQPERIEKWAENKLAYTIKQVDRGIYVLVYFRADPARIAEMRSDIALSEDILRVLILRAEGLSEARGQLYTNGGELIEPPPAEPEPTPEGETPEQAPAEAPAEAPEAEAAAPAEAENTEG